MKNKLFPLRLNELLGCALDLISAVRAVDCNSGNIEDVTVSPFAPQVISRSTANSHWLHWQATRGIKAGRAVSATHVFHPKAESEIGNSVKAQAHLDGHLARLKS
jgi:hypothetical protein